MAKCIVMIPLENRDAENPVKSSEVRHGERTHSDTVVHPYLPGIIRASLHVSDTSDFQHVFWLRDRTASEVENTRGRASQDVVLWNA